MKLFVLFLIQNVDFKKNLLLSESMRVILKLPMHPLLQLEKSDAMFWLILKFYNLVIIGYCRLNFPFLELC